MPYLFKNLIFWAIFFPLCFTKKNPLHISSGLWLAFHLRHFLGKRKITVEIDILISICQEWNIWMSTHSNGAGETWLRSSHYIQVRKDELEIVSNESHWGKTVFYIVWIGILFLCKISKFRSVNENKINYLCATYCWLCQNQGRFSQYQLNFFFSTDV